MKEENQYRIKSTDTISTVVGRGTHIVGPISIKNSARIDGHIVQGHVETVGEIVDIKVFENQTELFIKIGDEYLKYCIHKGSIAIDGVSLTIADINKNIIKVAIIPYTLKNTILNTLEVGGIVNIETDMFSKYVEKMIDNKED